MTIEQRKSEIVGRHLGNMLLELSDIGLDALGVAGGIVFEEPDPGLNGGSPVHVFHVIKNGVQPEGRAVDERALADMFIADVGHACLRVSEQ